MRPQLITNIILIAMITVVALPARSQSQDAPKEFVEKLERFIGTWKGSFEQKEASGFSVSIPVTITAQLILDKSSLQLNTTMHMTEGVTVEMMDIIGWDSDAGKIVQFTAGNHGIMFQSEGQWSTEDPNILQTTMERTTKKGTMRIDHSYARLDPQSLQIVFDTRSPDGTKQKQIITATKQK